MSVLGILGKIAGSVLPCVSKEKSKVESVDSLISKRGNATQLEVMTALIYKYLRLALYSYMVYNVIAGNVSLGEVLKTLAINIGG